MIALSKSKALVGLDIEAGSIAATEVHVNGSTSISATAVSPLAPGLFREGEITDPEGLGASLKEMFAEHKLASSVRLGVASQRVAVRSFRMPLIEDRKEVETAIRFQAQDHIPMPLDQAVLDYQVVNRFNGEAGERGMEVVVVAARREMVSPALQTLRIAGLRPVGIDLSAFGMIRALARENGSSQLPAPSYEERMESGGDVADGMAQPAKLFCNLGDVTNLAVAQGTACHFTRISPFGVEGIAQRLAERRGLTLEHARQWLVHVGLENPIEEVEGDAETVMAAREVLADGASRLVDELRLSLEFYGAQEGALMIEGIVACGPGVTIPGLVGRLERELGQPVAASRPLALAELPAAEAARLTLSYGLALEE